MRDQAHSMTMRCSALDRDSHNQDADLSPWEDPDIHRLADNGCCDTYDSWTRETDVEELARLRQVLVVMPEGGPVGWYSDWWNHGAGGPPAWETFHLRELRQVLEAGHGAGDRRVIAGLSMGGFGALSYAARQPGPRTASTGSKPTGRTRSSPTSADGRSTTRRSRRSSSTLACTSRSSPTAADSW